MDTTYISDSEVSDSYIELLDEAQNNTEHSHTSTRTTTDLSSPDQRTQLQFEILQIDKQIKNLSIRRKALLDQIANLDKQAERKAQTQHTALNEELKTQYTKSTYAWTERAHELLSSVFGIRTFRDHQEAIINTTLDNRDAVVVMPTGGGKSLCYQLPALISHGLTLVVSPLIALMTDQVLQLKELGIDAEAFTSESSDPVLIRSKIKEHITNTSKKRKMHDDTQPSQGTDIPSRMRLLYVSPEKLVKGKQFKALLEKVHASGNLARIVIDECHCASEYGNDFRPEYRKLGMLKYMFPDTPLLALSATCPPRVLESVTNILGIQGSLTVPPAIVYTSELWRPNLRYSIVRKADNAAARKTQVVEWITRHHPGDRGIIYCATRNDAYDVATYLHDNPLSKFSTGLYYGNLERDNKEALHAMWRAKQVQIIVATNAFGMGINTLDVRFVLHYTAPKSIENYYQESGRAGRDGHPADCVLFYRSLDSSKLAAWGFDEQSVEGLAKARTMVSYAEYKHICRKVFLLSRLHEDELSEEIEACGICDICACKDGRKTALTDCTNDVVSLLNIMHAAGDDRLTLPKIYKYWRGYALDKVPKVKKLVNQKQVQFTKMSQDDCGYVVNRLVSMGVLVDKFSHTAYATNAYIDIADRYRYIIGTKINDSKDVVPFEFEFVVSSSGSVPGVLNDDDDEEEEEDATDLE